MRANENRRGGDGRGFDPENGGRKGHGTSAGGPQRPFHDAPPEAHGENSGDAEFGDFLNEKLE